MAKKKVVIVQPGQGIPAVVDPNPARTASDIAESISDTEITNQQIANKQLSEQAHADQVQDDAQAQIDQNATKEAAADDAAENHESDMEVINGLMVQLGVDELFENSKAEYFTSFNLAVNSEGGKESRIRTHTK